MKIDAAVPHGVKRGAKLFSASLVVACIVAVGAACTTENIIQLQAKPKDSGKAVADSEVEVDAGEEIVDATPDVRKGDGAIGKAEQCASTFGTALTKAFGRLDGTVLAIVQPTDQQCALPNNDHVILQVTAGGDAYRMVINIQSDFGTDVRVRYTQLSHALLGPAWAEGWHAPASLDYVTQLGVHTNQNGFTPYTLQELSKKITADIEIGDKVSVYADSSGGGSAHKIHRNLGGNDGAIVIHATSGSPKFMLFHFDTQTF